MTLTKKNRKNSKQWKHLTPKFFSRNVSGGLILFFWFSSAEKQSEFEIYENFLLLSSVWLNVGVKKKKWLLNVAYYRKSFLTLSANDNFSWATVRKIRNTEIPQKLSRESFRKLEHYWFFDHEMKSARENFIKIVFGTKSTDDRDSGCPQCLTVFFCISATPEKRALSSTNPTKLMLVNVTVNWQRLKEAGEIVINENTWRQSYFQQTFLESLFFSLVFLCSITTRIWKFWEFLTFVQIDELLVLKTKSGC